MLRPAVTLFVTLLAVAVFVPVLLAQPTTLQGTVVDASGAPVPSAKITLEEGNRVRDSTTTDEKGFYSFEGIKPGAYRVRASAPQMTLEKAVQLDLKPGVTKLDLKLDIAHVEEHVNVESASTPAVTIDATNNASALVLRGDALDALSDDPEDLQADLQALAGPSAGPGGGAIYVDGFSGGELPPKESIREIRINQNPFSPEYDKLGLGRIEILTKPGSDQWRGNLNYNYGTDTWNSRNPYAAGKPPMLLNEWENTISGPLSKRASLSLDANQNNVDNGSIVNAVTLDPLSLTPSAFFQTFRTIQRRTRLYPRIDYQLNDKNTLSLRYSFTHGDISGAGIGGFDLISRGYHTKYTVQTVQGIETAVLSPAAINETRFQYYRNVFQTVPDSLTPEVQVLGSANLGGSSLGNSADTQTSYEYQNNTTIVHGAHQWRFGVRARRQSDDNVSPQNFNGTFTFGGGTAPELDANNQPILDASGQPVIVQIQSIERYRRTLLFQQLGYSPAQIRALGGGATQFSIAAGEPEVSVSQFDIAPFIGDDWHVLSNLQLNLGLRYEKQTNISDNRDWAPRIGLAWAPHGKPNQQVKTVIRAGFGIFYDRFALANTLTARRYNGIVQQQYIVTNPSFFGSIPPISSLQSFQSSQVTQEVDAHLRSPYLMQSAFTIERQLAVKTTLAITYTNSRGVHELRSLDTNAPLPGTFNSNSPGSAVYPFGNPNPLFLMTSSGVYNQNQLIFNFNSQVNKRVSLTGSYTFNHARSDTDGLGTFPANPYDYQGEYGPASTDIHHRVSLGGTISTRWNLRFSPLVNLQSGAPFEITAGNDPFGTTLFNARPGIGADPSKPGLIQTAYGLLDPNPVAGEPLLSRNFGRGPGQMSVNLRVGKTIAFGPEIGKAGDRRFHLVISMSGRNLLNHTNPGPIIGDITSPLFGRANQVAGSLNGEGFSENASNRRLEMQIKFTF
jgi:hypothetical protein